MWTIIIFSFITVVLSKSVKYDHGDIVTVLDGIVGAKHGVTEYKSEESSDRFDLASHRKKFAGYTNRQVIAASPKPFIHQQSVPHWYDHHTHHGHHVGRHIHGHHEIHKQAPPTERYSAEQARSTNKISNTEMSTQTALNDSKIIKIYCNLLKNNPVTNKPNITEIVNTSNVPTTSPTREHSRNTTTKVTNGNNASDVNEDRWVWDSGTTTQKPTTFGLGDRAAFSGDNCSTEQVKVGNTCVDKD